MLSPDKLFALLNVFLFCRRALSRSRNNTRAETRKQAIVRGEKIIRSQELHKRMRVAVLSNNVEEVSMKIRLRNGKLRSLPITQTSDV